MFREIIGTALLMLGIACLAAWAVTSIDSGTAPLASLAVYGLAGLVLGVGGAALALSDHRRDH